MTTAENRPPKLAYSVAEACQVSSLGRTSIFAALKTGRLRATRVGRRTLILSASLIALIEGRE